jgi:hypothetical protein
MTLKNLGRLERVELRYIWLSEASDFTPWLARKENLNILGETLRSSDAPTSTSEERCGAARPLAVLAALVLNDFLTIRGDSHATSPPIFLNLSGIVPQSRPHPGRSFFLQAHGTARPCSDTTSSMSTRTTTPRQSKY